MDCRRSTIGRKIGKCARGAAPIENRSRNNIPKGNIHVAARAIFRGIPYSQWNEGGNHRRGWYCCTLIGVLRMVVGVVEDPPTASEIGEARLRRIGMNSDGSQADRFVGT